MAEKLRSRNPPDITAPGIGVIKAFTGLSISILSLMALVIIAVVKITKKKKKEKTNKIGKKVL
jgi:hypothetical protein